MVIKPLPFFKDSLLNFKIRMMDLDGFVGIERKFEV